MEFDVLNHAKKPFPIIKHCMTSLLSNGQKFSEIICDFQATVTAEDSKLAQTYMGLTKTLFKMRFADQKSSFNNPSKRLSTELSKHDWHLKEAKLKHGSHGPGILPEKY